MNGQESFEGGCTCREIRYRLTAKPMFVHCCHCRWCQRETGSAFALNALLEADRVVLLTGTPGGDRHAVEQWQRPENQPLSDMPRRAVEQLRRAGDVIRFVRVGTLDEPDRFPPDIHIFTKSKQPWVVIPKGMATVEEYYRSKEFWPEASLARRRAVLG
jgi:hypothetical protein